MSHREPARLVVGPAERPQGRIKSAAGSLVTNGSGSRQRMGTSEETGCRNPPDDPGTPEPILWQVGRGGLVSSAEHLPKERLSGTMLAHGPGEWLAIFKDAAEAAGVDEM
ncbi:hypothetical protein HPP92_000753 [Vanilla planifolia]|uniref:Uncharacterized protein n=1 Tax=Vanilla planifolia TaxID=51239 RepID=A0A835S211_VANPL|nr:hypothetical protein HPP92_000753 [Vanilla planifolia]